MQLFGIHSSVARFVSLRGLSQSEIDFVRPESVTGFGLPGRCYMNAIQANQRDPRLKAVAGWLYFQVFGTDDRQFTQHWWNLDLSTGRHIDFSPGIEAGAAYFLDHELAAYVMKNHRSLRSHVAASVSFRENNFYLLRRSDDGSIYTELTDSLTTERLFSFTNID